MILPKLRKDRLPFVVLFTLLKNTRYCDRPDRMFQLHWALPSLLIWPQTELLPCGCREQKQLQGYGLRLDSFRRQSNRYEQQNHAGRLDVNVIWLRDWFLYVFPSMSMTSSTASVQICLCQAVNTTPDANPYWAWIWLVNNFNYQVRTHWSLTFNRHSVSG